MLHITGLSEGKAWSVYDVAGVLIYRAIVIGDKAAIPLNVQGMYIVISENRAIKIVNH